MQYKIGDKLKYQYPYSNPEYFIILKINFEKNTCALFNLKESIDVNQNYNMENFKSSNKLCTLMNETDMVDLITKKLKGNYEKD